MASWYSIRKNLPDASVKIACYRSAPKVQLFDWTRRFQVDFSFHKEELETPKDGIIIPSTTMAIRSWDQKHIGPVDSKSDIYATFVDCELGCGKFVAASWIDKSSNPFHRAMKRYSTDELTVNELCILKLWEKVAPLDQVL